jgi:hypothetical protein
VRVFPGSVSVSVTPGDMRVAAGRPATILATVKAGAGTIDRLAAWITLDAGGQAVTVPMERTATGYRFEVPRVERSFHYLVSAGPAASRDDAFRVNVTAALGGVCYDNTLPAGALVTFGSLVGLRVGLGNSLATAPSSRPINGADSTNACGATTISQGSSAITASALSRTFCASVESSGLD